MDDRLIVALDVPDALSGLDLATRLGEAVSFYKIGLGMLTGGGLALARELKDEHGKRILEQEKNEKNKKKAPKAKSGDIGTQKDTQSKRIILIALRRFPQHRIPQKVRR